MNAAVAFACTVVLMLAGAAVAIFSGFILPADATKQAEQTMQMRDLVMGVFVIGAALVAWQGVRRAE